MHFLLVLCKGHRVAFVEEWVGLFGMEECMQVAVDAGHLVVSESTVIG